MFPLEFKVTIGVTPELNALLTGFMGYLSNPTLPTSRDEPVTEVKSVPEEKPEPVKPRKSKKSSSPASEPEPDAQESEKEEGPEETSQQEQSAEAASPETSDVTVEMLRAKVKDIISADRSKRASIETEFAKYGASNPTTLDTEHYQTFWEFLNKL